MVEVILQGSKKLAKLPATLTLEQNMTTHEFIAHIKVDVSDTDMKDEATLLKRLKEYCIVSEPKVEVAPAAAPTVP